jgi:hypothetical protein
MQQVPAPNPIPEGYRWDGHRWVQPKGSTLGETETNRIKHAVALRDLVRSLRYFVRCDESLKSARQSYRQAAMYLAVSHSRSDYLEMPKPPWLVGDHVVDFDGHHFTVIVPSRLNSSSEDPNGPGA